jgi:3-oxoacyl-[acyl-carrier-protein] synthase II
MGVVSPLGSGLEEFCGRLLEGESAAGPISVFDPAALPTRIAAEVKAGEALIDDRKVGFGVAAARGAVEHANRAGVPLAAHYPAGSGGLSLGIGLELFSMPDMVRLLQDGKRGEKAAGEKAADEKAPDGKARPRHPRTFLQTPSDICLHLISREHGLGRAPLLHVSACAASTDAIGQAFRMIQSGERAWVLAGGTDSMINPMGVAGFCKIQAMTTRNDEPKRASRPFDRDRDGFLLGEGAGVLVLEPLEEAQARGARIYAEIRGYGNSFDAYGISDPHPQAEGAVLSMRRALESAALAPEAIGYVNAHGTSTPKNDAVETLGLRRVFGAHADRLKVNSTKSMIGHLISASGAVEVIAQIVCAERGWVHPTINLEHPDADCDLQYVRDAPCRSEQPVFLKNSFGFGGQNASLVVQVNGCR